VFGVDLYFARPEAATVSGLGALGFLAADGSLRILADLALIGLFGGFFIVPLFALVQSRTERDRVSRVIAANNILNALFMVVSALMALALFALDFTIPEILLFTALLNAVVAVYIYTLVPEFLWRFVAWLLVSTLYRVRIEGREHIPEEGPALIVCNHVSFMDAVVLMGAIRRPTRFVMYYKIHRMPLFGWLFRQARAIPIAGRKEDPEKMERAFAEVRKALAAGEIVGIFPEGGLTADGTIQPFRPGVERILAADPVPVVPMALRGLWGSLFSRKDRLRYPRRFRSKIALVIGAPIAPADASAYALEQRVRELRGDWA
jgi:1-acyl-sn-glycerol-3-phosphate acyltransferase